jgi:hypothetical protein
MSAKKLRTVVLGGVLVVSLGLTPAAQARGLGRDGGEAGRGVAGAGTGVLSTLVHWLQHVFELSRGGMDPNGIG